ncbi:LOW QUALITY PROTEIN: cytosolic 5'-nucleotidase 1A-like [Hypomesus transpacificus]|uniref:LOW QUALITY PROTEIN: cytosolic 5'-nucleotidase 1A-like n=1 Tax=Hypomesus transpacificus TaxID=137520 RepID=UPI001F07E620|nr:LOW QUALITY PROTEIN: cytosolic 5'-nucleotidase 1A-like [Hypomesus transpacificus]
MTMENKKLGLKIIPSQLPSLSHLAPYSTWMRRDRYLSKASRSMFNINRRTRTVKALMTVNSRLKELYPESEELFDIVLICKQPPVPVRLFNSINHHGLTINSFCMTGGRSPFVFLKAYMTNLYLSKDSKKVKEAIKEGIAAATMGNPDMKNQLSDIQLKVAFDGDGVLFSDESEIIFKEHGLDAFSENEKRLVNEPLEQGPFKCFLEALVKLQRKFPADKPCPIRTYLVTARSGEDSSGTRVRETLRSWGLEIDEFRFLAGKPKGTVLQEIQPHIFFDDQMSHIKGAEKLGTISAHVPYGICSFGKYHKSKLNEKPAKDK